MTAPGEAPRSISVSAKLYEKLEAEAERRGLAVSSLVEWIVAPAIGVKPPAARKFRKRNRRSHDV